MRDHIGIRAALLLAWIALLPGCTSPSALSNRALEFNEVYAQAADAQLLLNIVRAAYRNPTRYTAISQVRELRTAQGQLTLAAPFQMSPHRLTSYGVNPSAVATATQQPSFDVAPLDDRKAVLGLYRPIELQSFITYWQQAWPRAILFFLLVDEVILNQSAMSACNLSKLRTYLVNDKPYYQLNNSAYGRADFDRFLKFYNCVRGNIVLAEKSQKATYLRSSPVPPGEIVRSLPELAKGNFAVSEATDGGRRLYTISKSSKGWEFKLFLGGRPISLAVSGPPASEQAEVTLHLRSVDGIVYYLGELLRLQLAGERLLVPFGTDDENVTLFDVERNGGAGLSDRIEVEFLGEHFSVGRQPKRNDLTLTALSLVSQLFSLYREGTELPRTVAVQVVGGP